MSAEGVDPATLDLAGSPLYMSPLQVKHQPLSGDSDWFSLFGVMYRALTGKHPFIADKIAAINLMTLNAEPAPLRQVRPDLPEIMERIVKRAMAKDPARRYKTGIDIAGDLTLASDQVQFVSRRALQFLNPTANRGDGAPRAVPSSRLRATWV